jgi:hypothetical protein
VAGDIISLVDLHTVLLLDMTLTTGEANVDIDSEYNVFGHDSFRIVAHLCHYFFGPEWMPTTNGHLIGLPVPKGRPRYGQPFSQQAQLLPVPFKP